MSDVRLTATNPADSSVVPVACNDKGELLVDIDSNISGDLTVSGSVGIGTTSPATDLDTQGFQMRSDQFWYTGGSLRFIDKTSGTIERASLDSAGRLLVGTSSSRGVGGPAVADLQVEISGSKRCASLVRNGGTPILSFGTTGATGIGDTTLVSDGDSLGRLEFAGADGTDLQSIGAEITALVDGTPGSNVMPGRLVFSTAPDGTSSPTERMVIKSNGTINFSDVQVFADNSSATSAGLVTGDVYRKSDGTLMITF